MKKYELTENTVTINGTVLYQIKALRSFNDVNAGDLGGYVESEKKPEDIEKLKAYLQSGSHSKPINCKLFTSLMQAGYF